MNGLFPSHFALLEDKVAESHFDAIAISETKIDPRSSDSRLALDGFNFFHIDREGMGGGGVAQWGSLEKKFQKSKIRNRVPRRDII